MPVTTPYSKPAAPLYVPGRLYRNRPPNNSLQATTPAVFTSARCARLRFGLRVLRLSSMPFAVRRGGRAEIEAVAICRPDLALPLAIPLGPVSNLGGLGACRTGILPAAA